jgi:L-lactate dehydrogenase complex protein LldG
MTEAREQILSKIRSALAGAVSAGPTKPSTPLNQEGTDRAALVEKFSDELTRIGAKVYRAKDLAGVADLICSLAAKSESNQIVGWSAKSPEFAELGEELEQRGITILFDGDSTPEEFLGAAERAGIGVTSVDYAIADTGTLVVTSGPGKARSASLLPPTHVAIVSPDRIVPGLQHVFARLNPTQVAEALSAVTFITGPSRTADIELTLVVGVHGPQELHVVVMD